VPIVEDTVTRAAPGLIGRALDWIKGFLPSPICVRLEPGHPFELTHPADATGLALRTWRIEVLNKGKVALQGFAKLESIVRTDGSNYRNAFLPIGLSTQHQSGEGREAGPFHLRPGEQKLVEVASLDESDPASEIALHYETDKYPRKIPRADYRIGIVVLGGHRPRRIRCRLYVDGAGRLKLRREA
jgi:hypothetical protein